MSAPNLRRACIMGHPVAQSRSPMLHGYWLKTLRVEGAYELTRVYVAERRQLAPLIDPAVTRTVGLMYADLTLAKAALACALDWAAASHADCSRGPRGGMFSPGGARAGRGRRANVARQD